MSTYPYVSFVSTTPLPITAGEVLNKLWRALRGNARLFLLLSMAPMLAGLFCIVLVGVGLLATGQLPTRPDFVPTARFVTVYLTTVTVVSIPCLLLFAIFLAAMVYAALQIGKGKKPTAREAYAAAWSKAGRYCGLMLLQYLYCFGPCLVIFALVAAIAGLASTTAKTGNPGAAFLLVPFVFLLYFGATVYGIWMSLKLALAFPASIAEDLPATAAIKRSLQLTRKALGKLFLVLLVVYAISYAVIFAMEILFAIIIMVGAVAFSALHLSQILGIALAVIAGLAFVAAMFLYSALIWAAFILSFTIVYCDQRMRLDGPGPQPSPLIGGIVPA